MLHDVRLHVAKNGKSAKISRDDVISRHHYCRHHYRRHHYCRPTHNS